MNIKAYVCRYRIGRQANERKALESNIFRITLSKQNQCERNAVRNSRLVEPLRKGIQMALQ